MINILFFGQLKERLQCGQLQFELTQSITVAQLKQQLQRRGEQWQLYLAEENVLCALNHTMVANSASVKTGDEVAFFPPVTGG
ncbi:molybdopterin converting factor subunit 1 [Flocculibacter collagenilyticus]|uniref:molybdopterin converting factor subunit 1 n=1 Tax=Flocculibacter collagenilyticus TaxID=2744479 RepID=UPI0018F69C9F|nr:molybdopterin converting factor subunit 1 [Flocculibacter collagenilyticus]